jgi:hypothetical protein
MKIKAPILAALGICLLFLQSCLKDDSYVVPVSKEELLTHHAWKLEELTQVENNTQIYYKRGGLSNTNNLDDDRITFLADGTGTYSPTTSENYNITWEFTDASKTKMDIVITFSPTLITTLKCTELEITEREFFCVTNYLNSTNQPVMATVYRTPL